MRPLLVGEANPYSSDPADALLPWPERATGWRLALGRRVTEAFTRESVAPRRWGPALACWAREGRFYSAPHPSGLSRAWNDPGAPARLRALLAEFL